jgi:hypothetical protein
VTFALEQDRGTESRGRNLSLGRDFDSRELLFVRALDVEP